MSDSHHDCSLIAHSTGNRVIKNVCPKNKQLLKNVTTAGGRIGRMLVLGFLDMLVLVYQYEIASRFPLALN